MVVVRFAPSPTGLLHVGNARTALLNWLFAKKMGGRFLLRIDDTDAARSTKAFEEAIYRDLDWLGLSHDGTDRQINRLAVYSTAFYKLQAAGRVYPCFETEAELERQRSLLAARKLPPVYNRASLEPANKAKWEAEGRKPHWRFKLSRSKVSWTDLVRGPVEIDTATMSDPVLVREDGAFLYTLPSVADDIDMAISHVVRGEDHVTNTAAQIEIFEALGGRRAEVRAFPAAGGRGRRGAEQAAGLAVAGAVARRRHGAAGGGVLSRQDRHLRSVEPRLSLGELAGEFDFAKIGRAPAHFVPGRIDRAERKAAASVALQCGGRACPAPIRDTGGSLLGCGQAQPDQTVRRGRHGPAGHRPGDAGDRGCGPGRQGRRPAAARALGRRPPGALWTKAVSAETGAKGRGLFHPLRLALTGLEHGPELKKLLPLIGRDRSVARLKGETA